MGVATMSWDDDYCYLAAMLYASYELEESNEE